MELISRDEAIKALEEVTCDVCEHRSTWCASCGRVEPLIRIHSLPTIEERKEGHNLKAEYPSLYKCSECGWECWDTIPCGTITFNFCPNCGAKMKAK